MHMGTYIPLCGTPHMETRTLLSEQLTLFILGIYPEVAQLDKIAVSIHFEGPSCHFYKMAVVIYIPTNSMQELLFLYNLASASYLSPLILAGVR